MSVIAIAEKNKLFKALKLIWKKFQPRLKKNVIDLDYTVKQNIFNLSDYLNKNPENLTACILDRPRHSKIIEELKKLKVNLKLITDGDVSGALLVTEEKYNVDIFLGIGGGPEGVLAAPPWTHLIVIFKEDLHLKQMMTYQEQKNGNK